jgi:two-component system, sensor histidine kinase and response regulator
MKGDRELCLAAGMDGYIAKPIERQQLLAVIDEFGSTGSTDRPLTNAAAQEIVALQQPAATSSGYREAFDLTSLLEQVENDLDLITEMAELFLDTSSSLLAEVEAGVAVRDSRKIELAAHALKGAMYAICAEPGAEAAYHLETAGRAADLAIVDEQLAALKQEYQRLEASLHGFAQRAHA